MYKSTKMSQCRGCFPINQANQLAHMGIGGCLYCEDNESDVSTSSSVHDMSEGESSGGETLSWANRVLNTIKETKKTEPVNEDDIDQDCCICFETIGTKNNCITECGHKFCFKCLATAMTRSNACPYCRTPLIELPDEDDSDNEGDEEDDDYEESVDEGEEEESEAPVEVIVDRLKKNGFKMIDIVSLLLGRYSKADAKYTDEHIFEMSTRFDAIQFEADTEAEEQRMFAQEDNRVAV